MYTWSYETFGCKEEEGIVKGKTVRAGDGKAKEGWDKCPRTFVVTPALSNNIAIEVGEIETRIAKGVDTVNTVEGGAGTTWIWGDGRAGESATVAATTWTIGGSEGEHEGLVEERQPKSDINSVACFRARRLKGALDFLCWSVPQPLHCVSSWFPKVEACWV